MIQTLIAEFLNRSHRVLVLAVLAGFGAASAPAPAQNALPLELVKLPPGFVIEVVARVPSARAMTFGRNGTLFVGSSAGRVYAVNLPAAGSSAPGRVRVVASGLSDPAGVAFHDGALYIGAIDRIVRLDAIEANLDEPPKPVLVSDKLPSESHHGRKFIGFGPDGKLYANVGIPCNVCEIDRDRYGVIMRMNPDGSALQLYARGERNSVGFDWDPRTGDLWFTSNGRDMMGDDVPPDTLNHVTHAGEDFGFPYCHAGDIPDPQFGKRRACSEFSPPARKLGPHVASLGMRFYTGAQFPAAYRNQIFIAEHGSWNRSEKIGYRVTLVKLDASGHATGYEPFAEGWLRDGRVWGRPADVAVAPDGSLLVSDDAAGAIYRIRYAGAAR